MVPVASKFTQTKTIELKARDSRGILSDVLVFQNDVFTVSVCTRATSELLRVSDTTIPYLTHVSVSRRDNGTNVTWADLQSIKNAILGEHISAFEMYPPEDMLTDMANCYHLFAVPQEFSNLFTPFFSILNPAGRQVKT